MDWLLNAYIAHRGLHSDTVPENSLTAYSLAIEQGYNIEIDVHLSSDGEIMVFHDDTLARMCGIPTPISALTYNELRNLKLKDSDEVIPTLTEVLDLVAGKVGLLVEIKSASAKEVGELERKTYEMLKKYKGNYAIQSFNPISVKWFKNNAPEVARGILVDTDYTKSAKWPTSMLLKHMSLNAICKPQFIAFNEEGITTSKILKHKRKNLPVLSWTVRSQKRYNEIKPYVNNIIFELFIPNKK